MTKRFLLVVALISSLMAGTVRADEGMWLPSLIYKMNIGEMQEMGLKLNAEDIYSVNHSSLKDAVVALDRGSCTGEVISDKGLVLTNHHCGYGEIQAHSTPEHDYLKDGFWAKSMDQELPNPGKTMSFLISVEDVTEKVLAETNDDMSFEERTKAIAKVSAKLQKEAIKDTHYEAQVKSMFNGNQYYLFVYEVFKDIRLVGAPPSSIGKFGGDTDNWMWPRHTGDFSMFRIYCAPDGSPAEYSKDNVPYTPKHHLSISLDGYKNGDFAFVMGYPGSTQRYKTSYGIKYSMDITNMSRIRARGPKLDIIHDYQATNAAARIQYASKAARSSNYYKNAIGMNKGLKALNVVAKKQDLERRITTWINADSSRKALYGDPIKEIEDAYSDTRAGTAYAYLVECFLGGPEAFKFAAYARPLYKALEKEDQGKVDAAVKAIETKVDLYFKDYDAATDEKVAAALTKVYKDNVDKMYYPSFIDDIKGDDNAAYMAKVFDKTIFADKETLTDFLANPKLKKLAKDPVYQIMKSLYGELETIAKAQEATSPKLAEGRRKFTAALMAMESDKNFYPDANSTMRITYGKVGNYKPRDGVMYDYFTTMKGYIEKEIPDDIEFDVPARLKKLYNTNDFGQYADADGALHTCFTTNNDITGGNSGSPVMNAKGQLIGAAFDGNWEAMSGDIAFEPRLQKCINVDIRFVLWVIDKYAGATNLIDEMTLVKSETKTCCQKSDVSCAEKKACSAEKTCCKK
ncbi:MAG: S46 family peptidase [Mangrovibacterium sp.]